MTSREGVHLPEVFQNSIGSDSEFASAVSDESLESMVLFDESRPLQEI
jgi:hypothetical protein